VRENVKEKAIRREKVIGTKRAITYREGKDEFVIPRLHFRIATNGDTIRYRYRSVVS
jgi:hypothetical protein